jgi:Pyruvate/2-oxoacid:ferredoxin oxidoreductase delta subunit
MKRKIIRIAEDRCNGCGLCIPNCLEGAIQLIDGKARLISDLFCDGLGACLGHCPEQAITIEEREAEPYDEAKVMENIIRQGPNTVRAHLIHLKEHGEHDHLKTALETMNYPAASSGVSQGTGIMDTASGGESDPSELSKALERRPLSSMINSGLLTARLKHKGHSQNFPDAMADPAPRRAPAGGCPGSAQVQLKRGEPEARPDDGVGPSELTHWPVQLHLISPMAPAYQGADVVLAADCAAYAAGDFHRKFLKGRALAIACPKLDEGQEVYSQKISALIDKAKINTLTVVIMEVPCCGGLLRLAQDAAAAASRKIPVKAVVLGRNGRVLREEWT